MWPAVSSGVDGIEVLGLRPGEIPDMHLAAHGEHVIILHVRYAAYEALLDEVGDDAGALLAYNGEVLELMSPATDHERFKVLLDQAVALLALEWRIDVEGTGSVTLKSEPNGAEPDASYYVQNAARIVGNKKLDLTKDPPPDIVVEIDISRERIDKRKIYAALGVPEFWRYDGRRLRAYALRDGSFEEIALSGRLAGLPVADLNRFLERRGTRGQSHILREWQTWLRANRPSPER